jgi:hypothetical protein
MLCAACPATGGSGGTGGGASAGGGSAGGGSADGGGAGGGEDTYAQSATGNVKFKRSLRMTFDYSVALDLPPDQLCNELGQYPCAVVHTVALGGTDPYGIGLYEPLPFTGLSSPIATERVALNGCLRRVQLDLATPDLAVLYKGLTPDASGKLDMSQPAVHDALDTLYKRAVLRHATDAEIAHLKQLYADIEATGKPEPGKAWMQLSCFAVLTSVEVLFY